MRQRHHTLPAASFDAKRVSLSSVFGPVQFWLWNFGSRNEICALMHPCSLRPNTFWFIHLKCISKCVRSAETFAVAAMMQSHSEKWTIIGDFHAYFAGFRAHIKWTLDSDVLLATVLWKLKFRGISVRSPFDVWCRQVSLIEFRFAKFMHVALILRISFGEHSFRNRFRTTWNTFIERMWSKWAVKWANYVRSPSTLVSIYWICDDWCPFLCGQWLNYACNSINELIYNSWPCWI